MQKQHMFETASRLSGAHLQQWQGNIDKVAMEAAGSYATRLALSE